MSFTMQVFIRFGVTCDKAGWKDSQVQGSSGETAVPRGVGCPARHHPSITNATAASPIQTACGDQLVAEVDTEGLRGFSFNTRSLTIIGGGVFEEGSSLPAVSSGVGPGAGCKSALSLWFLSISSPLPMP